MSIAEILIQGGTSGMVVVVVIMFLRENRIMRREFLKTIENHLDHNTKVVTDIQLALERIYGWFEKNGRK